MKTKDLIAALQREDPTGELEVIAGGAPIHFAERQSAYYDGCLHIPVQDPDIKTYNVVGWKITGAGEKVRLHLLDLEGALENNPDLPVEFESLFTRSRHWEEFVEYLRETVKEELRK